jgi:hypothetical protein
MSDNHDSSILPKGFLADVMTAAGLVTHGNQCKELGDRLAAAVMAIRSHTSQPPAVQQDHPPEVTKLVGEQQDRGEALIAQLESIATDSSLAHGDRLQRIISTIAAWRKE